VIWGIHIKQEGTVGLYESAETLPNLGNVLIFTLDLLSLIIGTKPLIKEYGLNVRVLSKEPVSTYETSVDRIFPSKMLVKWIRVFPNLR
jgi:hypothetical protein